MFQADDYLTNGWVPPSNPNDWQQDMLVLHNQQRSNRTELTMNDKLQAAAQKHAEWMAATETLSHTGENGSDMTSRINAEGYDWSTIGENVAYGYPTVQTVVKGWMESYGHRKNIMNPDFAEVGFGKGVASNGMIYWCADFGRPMI
jgi:uncharacterized protein YkwD